jgi:hypothetical protein
MNEKQKKEWNAKRFYFYDRLRRDVRMSAATRLVGLEIGWCLNPVSGNAWPSSEYLKTVLNLHADTISVAIKELRLHEWYFVERQRCPKGRKNVFRPNFGCGLDDEVDRNFRSTNREEDRKKPYGKSECSLKEDRKNTPITPSINSHTTLSRAHSRPPRPPPPPPTEKAQGLLESVAKVAGLPSVDTFRWPEAWRLHGGKIVQRWLDEGWPDFVIVEAVRATMATKRDGPPNSPRYFEPPIRRMLAAFDRPLPVVREAGG